MMANPDWAVSESFLTRTVIRFLVSIFDLVVEFLRNGYFAAKVDFFDLLLALQPGETTGRFICDFVSSVYDTKSIFKCVNSLMTTLGIRGCIVGPDALPLLTRHGELRGPDGKPLLGQFKEILGAGMMRSFCYTSSLLD